MSSASEPHSAVGGGECAHGELRIEAFPLDFPEGAPDPVRPRPRGPPELSSWRGDLRSASLVDPGVHTPNARLEFEGDRLNLG